MPGAISTYALLQSTIASWLNRTNLTSVIPSFISLCEEELDLLPEIDTEYNDVALSLNAETVALPAGFREPIALYYDDNDARGTIELVSSSATLAERKATWGATGRPRFAAVIQNGDSIKLAPAPDQTYAAKLDYIGGLARLGGAVTSNWVLDSHSGLYLYGSLLHAAPYLKDDPRVATWQAQYERALAGLRRLKARQKLGQAPRYRPARTIG